MPEGKDLRYYMSLPYKVVFIPEEDGTAFTAMIPELEGCLAFGETIEEAYKMLIEAKELWLETALERGLDIPEPESIEPKEYSGRFSVRVPRYLHRALAELAAAEGTSLNQLVVALLAEGVERRRHVPRPRKGIEIKPFRSEGFASLAQTIQVSRRATRKPVPTQWPSRIQVAELQEIELHD